jgi:hypothetical protein
VAMPVTNSPIAISPHVPLPIRHHVTRHHPPVLTVVIVH